MIFFLASHVCFALVPGVYTTSINTFALPKQSISISIPQYPVTLKAPASIHLEGLINVDNEALTVDENGEYIFGTMTRAAMNKYRCRIKRVEMKEDRICIEISVLNIPLRLMLIKS